MVFKCLKYSSGCLISYDNVPHQRLEYKWEVVLHVVPEDVLLDRRVVLGLLQAVVTRVVSGLVGSTVKHHRSALLYIIGALGAFRSLFIWHKRFFPGMEATYPYAIKIPSRGLWVP